MFNYGFERERPGFLGGGTPAPWEPDNKGFETFNNQLSRIRLTLVAGVILNYIQDQNIANLLLVDRAARPASVAIRATWQKTNPGKGLPFNIYYVNPRGFLTPGDLNQAKLIKEGVASTLSGDHFNPFPRGRNQTEINAEFADKYQRLVAQKDKPLLVYDNCSHTGTTFAPITRALAGLGFADIRTGVAGLDGKKTPAPNLVASPKSKIATCAVFGQDRTTEKPFDSVQVRATRSRSALAKATRLRAEIKAAIEDPLNGLCTFEPTVEKGVKQPTSVDPLVDALLNLGSGFGKIPTYEMPSYTPEFRRPSTLFDRWLMEEPIHGDSIIPPIFPQIKGTDTSRLFIPKILGDVPPIKTNIPEITPEELKKMRERIDQFTKDYLDRKPKE